MAMGRLFLLYLLHSRHTMAALDAHPRRHPPTHCYMKNIVQLYGGHPNLVRSLPSLFPQLFLPISHSPCRSGVEASRFVRGLIRSLGGLGSDFHVADLGGAQWWWSRSERSSSLPLLSQSPSPSPPLADLTRPTEIRSGEGLHNADTCHCGGSGYYHR